MRVLVVGGGGREHALVWKLSQSPVVRKIYAAPGNAGMFRKAELINIAPDRVKELAEYASRQRIDLTVVGPELPLTLGIVEEFQKRRLRIFGPTQAAAQIEGSKAFAKRFMQEHHIPTASFMEFTEPERAKTFLRSAAYPLVIKADGLAAGKGAIICEHKEDAARTIDRMMVEREFGKAGRRVVVEKFLEGEEVTVMAFTDGKTVVPMIASQDHKAVFDGGEGPNTGGMGAYAPTTFVDARMMQQIKEEILEQTVWALAQEGRAFKGILYAGLMITPRGPKVIEFNCRFGDPETQVILPLLDSDLVEIFLSIIEGELELSNIRWRESSAVCVVLASGGYPGSYEKNRPISGLRPPRDQDTDVFVFHAGTRWARDHYVTHGGRVVGVTALGRDIQAATARAYQEVEKIKFEAMHYRRDIAFKALARGPERPGVRSRG
jgi:phosphoribosylamine--glycine ligase